MKTSLLNLLFKEILEQTKIDDYVNWACDELINGHDNEEIRMLAGFERTTSKFEAEPLFKKAINNAGIVIPAPDLIVNEYIDKFVSQIIVGDIDPNKGLIELIQYYRYFNFNCPVKINIDLYTFDNLREGISLYEEGVEAYTAFCPELATKSINEVIIEEAKLYLKYRELSLPENFNQLAYCGHCDKKDIPDDIFKEPNFIQKIWGINRKYIKSVCKNCGSEEFIYCTSQEGRKKFLTEKALNKKK